MIDREWKERLWLAGMLFCCAALVVLLTGCITKTTDPDGTVVETKGPPCGFICGVTGWATWKVIVDTGFFDPMSIGFEGIRKPVGDSEDDTDE